MEKVVIMILQGSVVTQTTLGGLNIHCVSKKACDAIYLSIIRTLIA